MENIKFFRSKNALSIANATTKKPSKSELIAEHISKLTDKANHIKTIENKPLRDEYLKKKKIYEKSLKMPEKTVKKLLFERVCVDIFELITNLSTLLDINLQEQPIQHISTLEIADNILVSINALDVKNAPFKPINTIYHNLLNLCDIYNFSTKYLTQKLNEVINAEGSFLDGLYVIYNI